MDIIFIISQIGTDVLAMFDNPVSVIFQVTFSDKQNAVSVRIDQYFSAGIHLPSAVNAFSNVMEIPRGGVVMIKSSFIVGGVNQFHADFYVAYNKEIFLTVILKTPSIHEQIVEVILSEITIHDLGYIERHGDACA